VLPYLSHRSPWFAFIVHPREVDDIKRIGGTSLLREHSASDEEFQRKACTSVPIVAGEILFGFSAIRGDLVAVMRMGDQIMGPDGRRSVKAAVDLAVARGAHVIGLGALTSPITGGGVTLVPTLAKGVTLTNGNAYTASVVRQNVDEVASIIGSQDLRVAVVGCTGSVGGLACQLLAERGYRLVLVGRSIEKVRRTFTDLAKRSEVAEDIGSVRNAEIVVLLTNDEKAQLRPHHVRPGAVVLDFAQPSNVSRSAYKAFAEIGVEIVEGGLVRIPSYSCTYDFSHPGPHDTFACLAETYLFANEGWRSHSVGRPTLELARRLERSAARHGIHPTPISLSR
jgi:fatty aldehyde-generating acyl-ACP reductase